jgi:hypothetical protein
MLLVEVAPEQRTADTAGYRPDRSAAQGISEQRTTRAAGDGAHRAIAATAAMAVIPAVAAIDPMMPVGTLRECGGGHERRCSHHRHQREHGQFALHILILLLSTCNEIAPELFRLGKNSHHQINFEAPELGA